MIPDVSQALTWLENNPHVLQGIKRGLERETLRVTPEGGLAVTGHPEKLGAALTHPWITTDFAEALMEFITPVDGDISHMLTFMRDVHRYVARNIGDERMWPLSLPCCVTDSENIKLAQYGTSNIGRVKTLYREGLKNRYGALMQTISGVHYNFSLPLSFWQARDGIMDMESGKEAVSAGYLRLIRNYHRFGWVIPYLFGASPAICSSLLRGKKTSLPFQETPGGVFYLPYATSLRLSDLGYTSKPQSKLDITFNDLNAYVEGLKRATKMPSPEFERLGLRDGDKRLQLNSNVLQIENELYASIRPKRVVHDGEKPSDALSRAGIEYVEVRSLDVNPFSPTGIDEQQVRFLDLFLVWCVLAEAPEMSSDELFSTRTNWNRIILEGRKPGLMLQMEREMAQRPLKQVGQDLFRDLKRVARSLDSVTGGEHYQRVCDELVVTFDDPSLTWSARLLTSMLEDGINHFGCNLSEKYRQVLINEPLEILSEKDFESEAAASWVRQRKLEASDRQTFDEYLANSMD